jgi:diguanylate cyclase (GGDEF)-like protein
MPHAVTIDAADEREVMARTGGSLWLLATFVAIAGQFLPGVPRGHLDVLLVLMVPVGLHGLSCVLAFGWTRVSMAIHAVSTAATLPLIGVALWATGGATSYLPPLLLLGATFIGYFQPPRWAWPLTVELILVTASPLIYDHHATSGRFIAWLLAFAATAIGITAALSRLKGRLVLAERQQHEMAHRDALTGLPNRRAFDASLGLAIALDEPFALMYIDLDDFKGINDGWGHPAGDRVLREIAAHCSAVVRDGDCLARSGGDEFAVVALGARAEGADRLTAVLEEAVGHVKRGDGDAPVRATVTSAAFPDDGTTVAELVAVADRALHARKRAQRPVVND